MKRFALLVFALFPSCAALLPRSTPAPVPLLEGGKRSGKELVVFLPGRWSTVGEFEREGFFRLAAERWPEARLVAVDLHLGYYKSRSMARRLHDDVIAPARAEGVRRVTVVGISMGGLGALIGEVEYPGMADELILLSPYLGEEEALQEIREAGGLRDWRPGVVGERDFSRKLWVSLKDQWAAGKKRPKLLLGCGNGDRLADASRLFEREFLKPGDSRWQEGGHDWETWRGLFRELAGRRAGYTGR